MSSMLQFLQKSGSQPLSDTKTSEKESQQTAVPHGERWLVCRLCAHPITRESEKIAVQGGHRRAFANPHGHFFQIGCFAAADGCVQFGEPTLDFTWFAGYAWNYAYCRGCRVHLGWMYSSTSGKAFYGLILDRLTRLPEQHNEES